jgi:hypothetical protein
MNIRHDLDFVPSLDDGKNVVVKAEILDIAPHLAMVATFVLYESAETCGKGLYQIGNIETGFAVGAPDEMRDFVIHKAAAFLCKKSATELVRIMNAAITRKGGAT